MERMFEADVIPACEELGIGFVPFSPLASGFLSGKVTANEPTAATTCAGSSPGSIGTTWSRTSRCMTCCMRSRTRRAPPPPRSRWPGCCTKSPSIVPIPGSCRLERIEENLGAADIDLTDEEFGRIEAELAKIEIHGNRTDEDIAKLRDLH